MTLETRTNSMTRQGAPWTVAEVRRLGKDPDSAVRGAYGMKASEDTLAFLLRLNLDLATQESKGHLIRAPSLPEFVPNPNAFAGDDCVQPPAPDFLP